MIAKLDRLDRVKDVVEFREKYLSLLPLVVVVVVALPLNDPFRKTLAPEAVSQSHKYVFESRFSKPS